MYHKLTTFNLVAVYIYPEIKNKQNINAKKLFLCSAFKMVTTKQFYFRFTFSLMNFKHSGDTVCMEFSFIYIIPKEPAFVPTDA